MNDPVRAHHGDCRWDGVDVKPYKEDDAAAFRAISRQELFADPALGCQLRYFEMEVGGYSSLERHAHAHAVMVLRGRGACLVGDQVREVAPFDLVSIPAWTWHQFRANAGDRLGFLCMVNAERDRPVPPTTEDLAAMRRVPEVARFLDQASAAATGAR